MKELKGTSRYRWMDFILGVLFIALGVAVFLRPGMALSGFVVLYGLGALLTGLVDIVLYILVRRLTGFRPPISLLMGIVNVVISILIFLNIDTGKLVLSLLFPVWLIAHCIARISNLVCARKLMDRFEFVFTLVVNAVGIVLGLILLFSRFAAMFSIVYIVGFSLIVNGIGSITSALGRLK